MEDTIRDSSELALTAKDDIETAKLIVAQQEKIDKIEKNNIVKSKTSSTPSSSSTEKPEDDGKKKSNDREKNPKSSNNNQPRTTKYLKEQDLAKSDNEFADQQGGYMFELFTIIPTSAYKYKESLSTEFKKQLHTVDKSIKVIGPIATDGTYYFSFKFFNRKLYNDYTDTVIKILKIDFTLLKATKDNFERALDQEYNARTCKTIRITNIPYHIDKEIIESCIISQLGEIDFTQEYLTNKQRSNAKRNPGH